MNAVDVLCAQLTRDLFAITKFLLSNVTIFGLLVYLFGNHHKFELLTFATYRRYGGSRPICFWLELYFFFQQ